MSPRFEYGLPGCVGTSSEDRMQNFHVPSRRAIVAMCITSRLLGIILARVFRLRCSARTSGTAKFFPAGFPVWLPPGRLRHAPPVHVSACCLYPLQPSSAISMVVEGLLKVTVYTCLRTQLQTLNQSVSARAWPLHHDTTGAASVHVLLTAARPRLQHFRSDTNQGAGTVTGHTVALPIRFRALPARNQPMAVSL